MRLFITLVLTLVVVSLGFSQAAVRTEKTSNLYKTYTAATTGDTLITKAAAAAGASILYPSSVGQTVGLLVGSPVASDTLIVKNGVGTVAQIILPSSGNAPAYYEFTARVDTSLIYIQKKTSVVTLLFRVTPLR